MKGFWKMLTGQGEKEYRQEHKKFNDAIPQDYPFRAAGYVRYGPGDNDYRPETCDDWNLPEHPAYSLQFGKTMQASNYRRAHGHHGPQAQREHEKLAVLQQYLTEYERKKRVSSYVTDPKFLDWLRNNKGIR